MTATPYYKVNVKTKSLGQEYIYSAYLEPKVKMTGLGWTNYPGSSEELYAFSFKKEPAKEFCSQVERRYGKPVLL